MGNNTNSTYVTKEGATVDIKGYSAKLMEQLSDHLDSWLKGNSTVNIVHNMSSEEIEYMVNHMEYTSHPLLRVEKEYHFDNSNYKEGDTLKKNNLFRSFSHDASSTQDIYDFYDRSEYGLMVIYRTVGDVPFFNPTKFTNPFPFQTERFVPVDSMKINKIHHISDKTELYNMTGLNVWIYPDEPVTVVDLSYDPSVKSVPITTKDKSFNVPMN